MKAPSYGTTALLKILATPGIGLRSTIGFSVYLHTGPTYSSGFSCHGMFGRLSVNIFTLLMSYPFPALLRNYIFSLHRIFKSVTFLSCIFVHFILHFFSLQDALYYTFPTNASTFLHLFAQIMRNFALFIFAL